MRILVFLCALVFCYQSGAQTASADSVKIEKNAPTDDETSEQKPISHRQWAMMLDILENEYDYICEDIYPRGFVAVRGEEYVAVNLQNGKETVVGRYHELNFAENDGEQMRRLFNGVKW